MRPRTLVLAAATVLALAACGGAEEEAPDQDAAATTQEDDADPDAAADDGDGDVDVTQDDEDRAQLETDDLTVDGGTGSLPEDWPGELTLPDVPDLEINVAGLVEMDGQRVIQANLAFPGELDDARTYFEGLEGDGFDVSITEDLDAPLPRIDAEVDGNGWEGTITAQEGPNIIVDYQLQGE